MKGFHHFVPNATKEILRYFVEKNQKNQSPHWFIVKINFMLDDKDPEEIIEIAEIAQNQGVDIEDAEKIKELMDEEGLDEDDAAELAEVL